MDRIFVVTPREASLIASLENIPDIEIGDFRTKEDAHAAELMLWIIRAVQENVLSPRVATRSHGLKWERSKIAAAMTSDVQPGSFDTTTLRGNDRASRERTNVYEEIVPRKRSASNKFIRWTRSITTNPISFMYELKKALDEPEAYFQGVVDEADD